MTSIPKITPATPTPGPWSVRVKAGFRITGPDGRSVCAISGNSHRPWEESATNAFLIGAAPDLLAAAEQALGELRRLGPASGASVSLSLAIKKAKEGM
jgi:hypothetical protein